MHTLSDATAAHPERPATLYKGPHSLLKALGTKYRINKTEFLQIYNLKPTTQVELQIIIEEVRAFIPIYPLFPERQFQIRLSPGCTYLPIMEDVQGEETRLIQIINVTEPRPFHRSPARRYARYHRSRVRGRRNDYPARGRGPEDGQDSEEVAWAAEDAEADG